MGYNFPVTQSFSVLYQYADMVKESRPYFYIAGSLGTYATADAQGWPTQDAELVLYEGPVGFDGSLAGSYFLSFTGQASVSIALGVAVWSFASGPTYDASTNTTTAVLTPHQPGRHHRHRPGRRRQHDPARQHGQRHG